MGHADLSVFSQQRQNGIKQLMGLSISAPGTQPVLVTALRVLFTQVQIVAETLIRGAVKQV